MDKYQMFVLKNSEYSVWNGIPFVSNHTNKTNDPKQVFSCIGDDMKIIINQDENYNIVKYNIAFWHTVSKVIYNGVEYVPQSVEYHNDLVVVPIDFNNQINEITLHFNGVIDPITLPVIFNPCEKSIYDEKVEKERQKELELKANISISTGADLVNIYFEPSKDNYGKSTIELWLAEGQYTKAPMVMGKHDIFIPRLIDGTAKAQRMIGKFGVEEGMMFKSINGLAKGTYGVKLSQYDDKGELLFESDFRYFAI